MGRSKWKISIISKVEKYIAKRNNLILKEHIDQKLYVLNGKSMIPVYIDNSKVGLKFGEFSITRKMFLFKKKKKRGT